MNDHNAVMAKDFFVYDFFTPSLAAGASGLPVSQTIQNDSSFLWEKTAFFTTFNDAAIFPVEIGQVQFNRVLPLITVQITDTSSGRFQFNREIPLPSIAGDGQFPFILPFPKLFLPKTTITLTLSNYSAATDYLNLHILLIGTKLFSPS